MSVHVGVLGATGAVGQRLIQLLDPHPEFEIAALTASESSAGKTYREAAKWRVDAPIPTDVAEIEVGATTPEAVPDDVDLIFSSLPSGVGEQVEPEFCEAGYVVSSNSSNGRLDDDVPALGGDAIGADAVIVGGGSDPNDRDIATVLNRIAEDVLEQLEEMPQIAFDGEPTVHFQLHVSCRDVGPGSPCNRRYVDRFGVLNRPVPGHHECVFDDVLDPVSVLGNDVELGVDVRTLTGDLDACLDDVEWIPDVVSDDTGDPFELVVLSLEFPLSENHICHILYNYRMTQHCLIRPSECDCFDSEVPPLNFEAQLLIGITVDD